MGGPRNGGGPPERRPAVANPYLKRAPGGGSIGGGGAPKPKPIVVEGGAGTIRPAQTAQEALRARRTVHDALRAASARDHPYTGGRPVEVPFDVDARRPAAAPAAGKVGPPAAKAVQATPKMAQGPPSRKGPPGARPRVTPTPKKARHHPQSNAAAPKAAAASSQARAVPAPAVARSNKPTSAMPQSVPRPAKPPVARRPGSLKSQLKSQIAALARQKKQFLEQKEAERQRAIQQKEMEKQRLLREKEMKREAKLREQRRLKEEEETRKQLVGKCLNDMVGMVEKRMALEKRTGVHYAIGEVMEGIVGTLEQREEERERAALEWEEESLPNEWECALQGLTPYHQLVAMNGSACWWSSSSRSGTRESRMPHSRNVVAPTIAPVATCAQGTFGFLPQPVPHTKVLAVPATKPAAPRTPAPPSVGGALGLHPSPLTDPHSPFVKSHRMLSTDIVVTKKAAGDSFGVTLRYESKSALVPREEDAANAMGDAPAAVVVLADQKDEQQPKKKRRKRIDFGVLMVINANKATFAGGALQHGDIIVAVNGRSIGGISFAEACKAIGTTAAACAATGLIQSSLRVARMNAIPTVSPAALNPTLGLAGAVVVGGLSSSTPAMPMVPFVASHPQFEFSIAEWAALIRGISTLPHRLFTGMAVTPVTQREVLEAIKKSEELGPSLQRRTVDAMEAKLAHESKRAVSEMTEKAVQYWVSTSLEGMTDAQRSTLRGVARPFKGCKCGSSTHERVDDPSCPLYADVRRYCVAYSITIQADEKGAKKKVKEYKVKSAMEQAYVDRFRQQRAESAADKKEAEFVLEMEKIQSSRMKKAVAPSSLCTMVLSAVASLADIGPGPEAENGIPEETPKTLETNKQQSDSDSDDSDSDSDDDDVPLTSLRQSGGKRAADKPNPPASKRPKAASTESDDGKKAVPSPYILAELLKRMSETQGHLFAEPDHSEYAWQQRHRSTMTTPLPKEVMFKGSPREPGRLSFENIRLLLDGERMARLRQAWMSRTLQQQLPNPASQPDQNAARRWNDEWIVALLSSDAITGLCHEISVLVGLNILAVSASGRLSLAKGWEQRVPQMVLNEMRDEWGPDVDRHNLHCIHEEVRSTLHEKWEHEEDGWRMVDSDDLVFDDNEYELRKQIFTENFSKWVAEKSGQGDFGV